MTIFSLLRFLLTVAAYQEMQPLLHCGGCGEPSVLLPAGQEPGHADGCVWIVDTEDGCGFLFDCAREAPGRDR